MIDPTRMLVCVLALLTPGGTSVDQNGEIIRILRQAHEIAVTMPNDRILTKFSILDEIARFQAFVNDQDESSKTIEDALKESPNPSSHQRIRDGIRVDVLHSTAVLRIEQGDAKAAVEPLREYARLVGKGLSPGWIPFYLGLLKLQVRAGDRDGASESAKQILEFAEKLPATPPEGGGNRDGVQTRPRGLLLAAHAFGLADQPAIAENLRRRAIREAESIADQNQRRGQIGTVIEERARLGDLAGAVAWLDARRELFGDGWNDQLAAISYAGAEFDPSLAVRTAARIGDPLKKILSLSAVARKLGDLGRWRDAANAWVVALPEGKTLLSRNLLAELVYAQAKAGDRDAALATTRRALREAERPGYDRLTVKFPSPGFYARLSAGVWLAGDREAAATYLRQARTLTDAIRDDPINKSGCLTQIAETYADMGDFDHALEMLTESMIRDSNLIRPIVEAGALARVRAGDVEGAFRLFNFLASATNYTPAIRDVARKVAKIEAKSGDLAVALRWAEGQSSPENKAVALIGVCSGLLERSYKTP